MGDSRWIFSLRSGVLALWAFSLVIGAAMQAFAANAHAGLMMGCVGLLPLFFAIRFLRPYHALAAGLVWGSSVWLFGGVTAQPGTLGPFTSLILLSFAPGLFCLLTTALARRIGFHPLVIGVGWMALELSLAPVGFEHGLIAGATLTSTLFGALGKLFGYVLVAFVVAFVVAIVVGAVGRALGWASSPRFVSSSGGLVPRYSTQTLHRVGCWTLGSANPRAPPVV